ncbi:hypothetical protein ABAC402_15090 [Asticcacaulis sp. AC402]|nr:hypothetical protein ABAC402_15090 [Asticcacaulis sp. AC402]
MVGILLTVRVEQKKWLPGSAKPPECGENR